MLIEYLWTKNGKKIELLPQIAEEFTQTNSIGAKGCTSSYIACCALK